MSLCALTLTDAAAGIDEVDARIEAWTFLDREHVLRQAEAADEHRRHGRATGPLHGVPVGIKDLFDTGDMPTEFGSPLWAGRTPRRDAVTLPRSPACARPAPSSWARRSPPSTPTSTPARPAIRTIPNARPAAPPAARRRPSLLPWCRAPSARRLTAR
jgi:hypothetical protein